MTPKQYGVETGYRHDQVEKQVLPPCPYALWTKADGTKIRNVDRDEWLSGWFIGRGLRRRHEAELVNALDQAEAEDKNDAVEFRHSDDHARS